MGRDDLPVFPTPRETFGLPRNDQRSNYQRPPDAGQQYQQQQNHPSMNTADYFDIPALPRSQGQGPPQGHPGQFPSSGHRSASGGSHPNNGPYNNNANGRSHNTNSNTGYPSSMYSSSDGGYREPQVPRSRQHPGPSPTNANRSPTPSQQSQSQRYRSNGASPADLRGSNLRDMFNAFDKNKSGYLSEGELAAGLYNDDGTRFARDTTRLMFRMFDLNRSGKINFDEFVELWRYLCEWKGIFQRMDVDESRKVIFSEFRRAVESFGYNLGPNVIKSMFSAYASSVDMRNQPAMSFDMFVQAFVRLRNITESFKRFDTDRDGFVTMGFEQYLLEVTYLQ